MLVAALSSGLKELPEGLQDATAFLWQHRQVRSELRALFDVLSGRIQHVQPPLDEGSDVPLRIHARYTRREILAAFDLGKGSKLREWREGVLWVKEANADLLAFTIDKTHGGSSPTTRYRDYAVNRDLIHWESQSTTPENSETGRRYQTHAQRGSAIMLFARENTGERAYWFLGPATYVSHQSELPMAVTWKLKTSLPGDLFSKLAAAVA